MAGLNPKQANKSLLKKGFVEAAGDHHFFEFWHNGVLVLKTRTSRGTKEIHDGLISSMSNQCKVSANFFKEFARCTKSKAQYISELKKNSII